MKIFRILLLIFVLLLIPGIVLAATVTFDLQSGPGVKLRKVDIEESGAVYRGNASGVKIEIGPGEKLFRAIITADVMAYQQEVNMRQAYYRRFTHLGSNRNRQGVYHVYQIRDVVRFPINVVNGGTVNFKIHFDPTVPGLTYEYPRGNIVAIDRMARLQDGQHFGIVPKPFTNNDSTSPRSRCVEWRNNPDYPMIRECARWETQ